MKLKSNFEWQNYINAFINIVAQSNNVFTLSPNVNNKALIIIDNNSTGAHIGIAKDKITMHYGRAVISSFV